MLRQGRLTRTFLFVVCGGLGMAAGAAAQALPAPDPFPARQNIFYGEVPPDGAAAPILVFVHGINGVASDWWQPPNDMYALAYAAGYRTAFVSLNPDNTRNNDGIFANAAAFKAALPLILTRYRAAQAYVVAHSKGGVDAQLALLDPDLALMVRAVFTIATPHQGTELADWAFGAGQATATALGLVSPAVGSLRTQWMALFRQVADKVSSARGVPYYTIEASSYATPPNPLTAVTGPVLASLAPELNDGVVTVPRATLPATYAVDLGVLPVNHFAAAMGTFAFPRINAQVRAIERLREYERIATGGFSFDGEGRPLPGDRQNSYPWSTQWFKGKLYVGTGRATVCVATATSDAASGRHDYPPKIADIECTPDPKDLPLAAEIWRFTPENATWERVYQSPYDVPIEFDADGNPTRFTARDTGFRGMAVFAENDGSGTERLYVGSISASGLFDELPAYSDPAVRRFPPARIVYTQDGVTWHSVPQTPGTFFGDLNIQTEVVNKRGFRSFATLRGTDGVNRLFVTVTDARGVGRVIASSNPSAGDNTWRQVSPSADVLPIFTIYVYRNEIYATVGDHWYPGGYAIFKTDAETPDPSDPTRYLWTPVVLGDGMQLFRPRGAVSMQEFQGRLYVGTDRPTELIRINPDGTWDLVVGPPRMTASGYKRPLSGIAGRGFNNFFTGHLYTMAVHDGTLYIGTWDWSQGLEDTPLKGLFNYTYGFDFFKSRDGVNWSVVDRTGLGDPKNLAIRNLESTPFGLFVAAANSHFGLQIFQNRTVLDLDRSGAIDSRDVNLVMAGRGPARRPIDPRDLDRDGWITVNDARKLATQCTAPACTTTASKTVTAPSSLMAVAAQVTGSTVALSWTASPEAATYHVYRADPVTLESVVPPGTGLPLPNGTTLTVEDLKNGAVHALCLADASELTACALVEALQAGGLGGKVFRWIGSTPELSFADPNPPDSGQALYYVTAQDATGRISEPTNLVAAPSDAEAPTVARLGEVILRLNGALPLDTIEQLGRRVSAAATAVSEGRLADAQVTVAGIGLAMRRESERGATASNVSLDALHVVEALDHYLRLASAGRIGNAATRTALLSGAPDVGSADGRGLPMPPRRSGKASAERQMEQ